MLNYAEIPEEDVCPGTTVSIWLSYDFGGLPNDSHDLTFKVYSKEKVELVD